jgi:starch phosphorylase
MMSVIPRFNMRRVLHDYTQGLYEPAMRQYRRLAANDFAGASELAQWKQRVREAWSKVSLRLLADAAPDVHRGEKLSLEVAASLNGLQPADVRIEFIARRLLPEADLGVPPLSSYRDRDLAGDGLWSVLLNATGDRTEDGSLVFALDTEPKECGQFATEVRIYPWHELLSHPHELGLMKWL